ncbi:ABC transporter ATP-binding protein [Paenisporosarcina antarctica]|uniref:Quaternary amine transport ATP-binding protein n=1 Tax=Paenisporosarcina antarctica TaxID=417367 RepID=A0A4P6ZUT0_9BACL|nr:betaine/proline/choline family ABC transporter ATP-binding protein [Paenisporosarcina antarctica]QBP39973.1 ATP-binding cassette domain-containing protein [Paenisporosarcina antarctica]
MIRFDQVTKQFADGTEALKNVSLTIPTGKLTVIIGPSGCGKTTLMKMINHLEAPTSGEVLIDELSIKDRDDVELRRSIGYVIQRIGLFPHMTIARNASIVPKLKGWSEEKTQTRIRELMNIVGLDPDTYLERFPLELSGGQQQRIGVVRALAGDPNIMLMDEPFSALDPISREQLQDELLSLQKRINKTIVFVTHDMDEALKIADHIIVLRAGEVEQIGSSNDLIHEPKNDFVRNFIGQDRINRKRTFGKRKIRELSSYFLQSKISEQIVTVNSTENVEVAITLLDQPHTDVLAVYTNDELVGYITQSAILNAVVAKEEGAPSHD